MRARKPARYSLRSSKNRAYALPRSCYTAPTGIRGGGGEGTRASGQIRVQREDALTAFRVIALWKLLQLAAAAVVVRKNLHHGMLRHDEEM